MRKGTRCSSSLVGTLGSIAIAALVGPAISPAALLAQSSAPVPPEAPVRYDEDLLPPAFHAGRRALVRDLLPEGSVALFFSAPERNRQNDVAFEYRQDSDLLYLTGMTESGSVLLLAAEPVEVDGEEVTELLFVPARDPARETWTGRRFGPGRAQEALGIAKAVDASRFEEIIGPLLASRRLFHTRLPDGVPAGSALAKQLELVRERASLLSLPGGLSGFLATRILGVGSPQAFASARALVARVGGPDRMDDPQVRAMAKALTEAPALGDWLLWKRTNVDEKYADGTTLPAALARLRSVKTDEELALMRRAIDITADAQREAMRSIEPGMHEYEVEGLIEYVFRREGAEYTGFPSIVGSGENSVVLHYESNRRRMEAPDVVVMDIGAEYHGYSADITRTVPVDATFSEAQRAIYEIVLEAQAAGIEAARAGSPFFAPNQAAFGVVASGLKRLGLIEGIDGARRFLPHPVSHYLGLDVHDTGPYDELVPGQVITVEPGIYIPASADVDPKWWNIGVRIEDDVLVTDGDPVVLSEAAPRSVSDIEALMRETGIGNVPTGDGR
ncbi:MAG: aminopeptidase P N-terminal domain-containing protein [Gemmatimonadota bacterium]